MPEHIRTPVVAAEFGPAAGKTPASFTAIDAPAWHTTAFPSSFYPRETVPGEVVVESRVGDGVVTELRRRGHTVVLADAWSLGRLSAAYDVSGVIPILDGSEYKPL